MYSCCVQLFLQSALAAVARAAFTLNESVFCVLVKVSMSSLGSEHYIWTNVCASHFPHPSRIDMGPTNTLCLVWSFVLSITALVCAVGKEISQRGPEVCIIWLWRVVTQPSLLVQTLSDMSGWSSHMTTIIILIRLFSDMSGGAKRKTAPAKLDLTEEQKSDIKKAFRWSS